MPSLRPAAGSRVYTSGWTMMSAMTQAPEFDIELSAARSVRTLRASLSGELPANAIALCLRTLRAPRATCGYSPPVTSRKKATGFSC